MVIVFFCGKMEHLKRSGKQLLEEKRVLVILRRLDLILCTVEKVVANAKQL